MRILQSLVLFLQKLFKETKLTEFATKKWKAFSFEDNLKLKTCI